MHMNRRGSFVVLAAPLMAASTVIDGMADDEKPGIFVSDVEYES